MPKLRLQHRGFGGVQHDRQRRGRGQPAGASLHVGHRRGPMVHRSSRWRRHGSGPCDVQAPWCPRRSSPHENSLEPLAFVRSLITRTEASWANTVVQRRHRFAQLTCRSTLHVAIAAATSADMGLGGAAATDQREPELAMKPASASANSSAVTDIGALMPVKHRQPGAGHHRPGCGRWDSGAGVAHLGRTVAQFADYVSLPSGFDSGQRRPDLLPVAWCRWSRR